MIRGIIIALVLFILSRFGTCLANEEQIVKEQTKEKTGNFWNRVGDRFGEIWNSEGIDIYIPINTWHNRAMYDKEKSDTYNERPWGIGFGKTMVSENGNTHQLYIMEFQDSHDKIEPIFGYNFYKNWYYGKDNSLRIGLGITASITMRHEYHYIPLPLPLPLFSISYRWFSIENTYIPGIHNGGNVLFTWARVSFKM